MIKVFKLLNDEVENFSRELETLKVNKFRGDKYNNWN